MKWYKHSSDIFLNNLQQHLSIKAGLRLYTDAKIR